MKKILKAFLVFSIIIFIALGAILIYKTYAKPTTPVVSAVKEYQKELEYGNQK